jgi:hypothetical protein
MRRRWFSFAVRPAGVAGAGLVVLLSLATPLALAAGDKPAPTPCDQVDDAIKNAPGPMKAAVAAAAIDRKCVPLPAGILAALRGGQWAGPELVEPGDRVAVLVRAAEAHYAEAESLAVQVLEAGAWPDGAPLGFEPGAIVIRSLKGAMNRYRTHLCLDVYEQVKEPIVRQAVIQALRGSTLDEALLPAVEAALEESGTLHEAGITSIADQPEKTPPLVLARLVRKLPEGPLLNWALRLSNRYPSSPVAAAKKERGING